MYQRTLGDAQAVASPTTTAAAPSASDYFRDAITSNIVTTASAVALTYHGYKRTGSIVWALIYGLAGKAFPLEAVPIAIGQGFGQKKSCP